ncbi:flagellar basal body rod protein FlgB [Bacillus massilinigeriensis]|uniref:flagellar basal body rod protein FlgB n=1 Tax=Bacillus mediterraneensis TaxID=1805474 RepID=UPI0008F81999|nr:flagellar basal body rod protein FlgB [Bacillus mediterraneensis]
MKLFSDTFSILEKGMDYSSLQQKVISQNIANADTPNYKPKGVAFKSFYEEALRNPMEAYKTNVKHFDFQGTSAQSRKIITRSNVNYNANGNGVDLDKEMSNLAGNQIYFNALTDRISGKFNSLQTVIRGGK